MRANAEAQTVGARKALGVELVVGLALTLALGIAAPLLVVGGMVWAAVAAIVLSLAGGFVVAVLADAMLAAPKLPAHEELGLAA